MKYKEKCTLSYIIFHLHSQEIHTPNVMCQQTKCCCCLPLRTGCIVIAILTIAYSFTWYIFGSRGGRFLGTRIGYGYIVPINLWGLAEGTCLLIGALLNNATLVLVHFILAIIGTVGTLILVIVNSALANYSIGTPTQDEKVGAGLVVVIWVSIITFIVIACLVRIYFIVVAWFFYKELKTGGENISHPSV